MSPVRARTLGGALLLLATVPGCAGPQPAPIIVAPSATTSAVKTTQAAAGALLFEIDGPPGSNLNISWGVGTTTAHTDHPAPWSRQEIAPLTPFAVTLQASLQPPASGSVTCRITLEGKPIATQTREGGALCTAMGLDRENRFWTP